MESKMEPPEPLFCIDSEEHIFIFTAFFDTKEISEAQELHFGLQLCMPKVED